MDKIKLQADWELLADIAKIAERNQRRESLLKDSGEYEMAVFITMVL